MEFQLPAYVLTALEQLNTKGFEAYVVGGCVRDMLLGKTPYDFDVCTNATPQQMIACFQGFRTIHTGIVHGTITVIIQEHPVEITTYRVDGDYTDHRHPDGVQFTSCLQEDLARRDFTVNAMAYHPQKGLVDLYGGREDLNQKVLRCVGEPALRFSEDALRILRGLRFAATLDFTLESSMVSAMVQLNHTLKEVAMERVFQEFTKLLCGIACHKILQQYRAVLTPLFSLGKDDFSWMAKLPQEPCFRYAALLRLNENSSDFLKKLKAPNLLISQVEVLTELQRKPLPATMYNTRMWIFSYGIDTVKKAEVLHRAYGRDTKQFSRYLNQIQKEQLCCSLKELAVKGSDLLAVGIPAGKHVGDILHQLLGLVMQEQANNSKQELLLIAKTLFFHE